MPLENWSLTPDKIWKRQTTSLITQPRGCIALGEAIGPRRGPLSGASRFSGTQPAKRRAPSWLAPQPPAPPLRPGSLPSLSRLGFCILKARRSILRHTHSAGAGTRRDQASRGAGRIAAGGPGRC